MLILPSESIAGGKTQFFSPINYNLTIQVPKLLGLFIRSKVVLKQIIPEIASTSSNSESKNRRRSLRIANKENIRLE
jgi:hypothetical protein